jgi:hypothetical protein
MLHIFLFISWTQAFTILLYPQSLSLLDEMLVRYAIRMLAMLEIFLLLVLIPQTTSHSRILLNVLHLCVYEAAHKTPSFHCEFMRLLFVKY